MNKYTMQLCFLLVLYVISLFLYDNTYAHLNSKVLKHVILNYQYLWQLQMKHVTYNKTKRWYILHGLRSQNGKS